jgi:hypothetical protein
MIGKKIERITGFRLNFLHHPLNPDENEKPLGPADTIVV